MASVDLTMSFPRFQTDKSQNGDEKRPKGSFFLFLRRQSVWKLRSFRFKSHVMHSNRMRDTVSNSKKKSRSSRDERGEPKSLYGGWYVQVTIETWKVERYAVWFMKRWHTTVTASPNVRAAIPTCFLLQYCKWPVLLESTNLWVLSSTFEHRSGSRVRCFSLVSCFLRSVS